MGILGAVEEVERRVHAGGRWRGEGSGRRQVVLLIFINIAGNACVSLPRVSLVLYRHSHRLPSVLEAGTAPHRTSLIV